MKHKNEIRKLLAIFFGSILVTLIITPLRAIDLGVNATFFSSIGGLVGYFIFTNYVCKHYGQEICPKYILWAVLLGIAILQVPIRIIDLNGTLWSLPDFIVHLLGIIGGYEYYRRKGSIKYAVIYIIAVYCIGATSIFITSNIINYHTLSGLITSTPVTDFTMKNNKGEDVSLYQFRGKILVVDCWYEQCGVCFREFPNFQKICNRYLSNKDVECISMNIPYSKDEDDPRQMIRENGYTFPVFVLPDKDVRKRLNIDRFPVILVFNRASELIYRGNLEGAKLVLKYCI